MAENHKFDADIQRLLKIVTHSLYHNKDIFLRELISNSADACDKLRYNSMLDDKLISDKESEFKITIETDKENKTLVVSDNGIGMSKDDLIENLGTIASSGTRKFAELLEGNDSKLSSPELIGQFGVGFYSSFMVSDQVIVKSRKAGTNEMWMWKSAGEGEFDLESVELEEDFLHGTVITLIIKEDAEEKYLDFFQLKNIAKTYCNHINFAIEIKNNEGEWERCNSEGSLWLKAPNSVTQEEHNEFFKTVSDFATGEPLVTIHNRNEGRVECTNLFYVPSSKPMNLFNPEMRCSVKLYCKQVAITGDNIEIVPKYLRFVRGVVDSPDIPLNISRDTLQDTTVIRNISTVVTGKILKGLTDVAKKDEEKYDEFWKNFGEVFKEGLCDQTDTSNREKLLSLCRFQTSREEPGKLISLDQYVDRLKDGQKTIYYCIGDKSLSARLSPQLQAFLARDLEVLLLDDTVDSYWTIVGALDYKECNFQSITAGEVDIEKFDIVDEDMKKQQEQESTFNEDDQNNFVKYLEEVLTGRVESVKISKKLTSYPVCLSAASAAGMDIRLQRLLVAEKQMADVMPKCLEVNLKHPIMVSLMNIHQAHSQDSRISKTVRLLFDYACITEKEPISNPSDFLNMSHEILMELLSLPSTDAIPSNDENKPIESQDTAESDPIVVESELVEPAESVEPETK